MEIFFFLLFDTIFFLGDSDGYLPFFSFGWLKKTFGKIAVFEWFRWKHRILKSLGGISWPFLPGALLDGSTTYYSSLISQNMFDDDDVYFMFLLLQTRTSYYSIVTVSFSWCFLFVTFCNSSNHENFFKMWRCVIFWDVHENFLVTLR